MKTPAQEYIQKYYLHLEGVSAANDFYKAFPRTTDWGNNAAFTAEEIAKGCAEMFDDTAYEAVRDGSYIRIKGKVSGEEVEIRCKPSIDYDDMRSSIEYALWEAMNDKSSTYTMDEGKKTFFDNIIRG